MVMVADVPTVQRLALYTEVLREVVSGEGRA